MYGLEFLEVYPDYECFISMKWVNCDREHICTDHIPKNEWRINYDSENSYHNWVDPGKLDLTCVDKNVIGLLGSAYFLGFAISSGITPNLADKYGRKKPYQGSLIVQTMAYFVIIMSKNV